MEPLKRLWSGPVAMGRALAVVRVILWLYGTAVLAGVWVGCGTGIALAVRDGDYYRLAAGIVLLAVLHPLIMRVLRWLSPFTKTAKAGVPTAHT